MTPTRVAHIMSLPAKYQTAKRAVAKAFQTENFDARIESLTNLDIEVEAYARAAVEAALPPPPIERAVLGRGGEK